MLREVARLLVSILDVKKTVSVASSQSGGDDPLMLESLFLLRSVLSTRDDPDQVLLTQMPPPQGGQSLTAGRGLLPSWCGMLFPQYLDDNKSRGKCSQEPSSEWGVKMQEMGVGSLQGKKGQEAEREHRAGTRKPP